MKFRRSGPALIIGTSMTIIVLLTALALSFTSSLLHTAHEQDYVLMRQVLASVLSSTEDKALVRAELVSAMPAVRTAFEARDRPKLLAECQDMFKEQEEKYGLDRASFHTPPGVTFLRLHSPARFGDDERSFRPMLADVHQNHVVRKGLVVTKSGPNVTGIVPMMDAGGKFVGTFEMGLEFGPILDRIKASYGIEAAVFFDEKLLHDVATDLTGDVMTPKNRVGKYIRFHATHPDLIASLVSDRDIEVTNPKSYERTSAGAPWGVQLVPLYDYGHKQIGVVALATSFDQDKALAGRARIWLMLASFVGILFSAGMTFVVIRGLLLAPLAGLNDRMAALAEGDATKPAEPLEDYCDELQSLATQYERIRSNKGS